MDDNLLAYLPMDRRHAMAAGRSLPHAAQGAALFADISGFTPLTEALVRELGPQRGAEELTSYINRVYDALIDEIHRWRGSVIAFAGDAVTCWFDDADTPGLGAQRAVAAAFAMQAAMDAFAAIATPFGSVVSLSMKAAVAAGPVRRFLVGDPAVRVIDAIAGRTLERLAAAEHEAAVRSVLAPCAVEQLAAVVTPGGTHGRGRACLSLMWPRACARATVPASDTSRIDLDAVRTWLLASVYTRFWGLGEFALSCAPRGALPALRAGIDYDDDPAAGAKLTPTSAGSRRWSRRTRAPSST
ncbi:MAG: hypothetical protein R3A10_13620 [Caldilineaceae bacterium]